MKRLEWAPRAGAAGLAMVVGLGVAGTSYGVERIASAASPVIQAVLDCRQAKAADARLACYDTAVARLAQALGDGDLVSFDRAQRREVRRQAFGFNMPSLSVFDRGERPEEADSLTTRVQSASRKADGRWVIVLDGGQVWRQTDSMSLARPPRPGSAAVIQRASLGSFMISIDGHPGFRARRDD
jgi:hypothetical protein